MKSAAVSLALLALACPAFAQERTVAVKDLVGASPDAVRERLGLASPADWAPRLIAWHDGKRFELLRPSAVARPSFCDGRAWFSLQGDERHFDSFLFVDGALVATIAFGQGPMLRQGPEDSLRFEEGVGSFLTDVAAERASDDAMVAATCYAKIKVKRPRSSPAEVVYGVAALVWFSPLAAVWLVDKAGRNVTASKVPAIMARLQVGRVLDEDPEAFARAHGDQVEWHPSVYTEGYGIMTVELGEPAHRAAEVGVRNGRIEWVVVNGGSPRCGRMRQNISAAFVGCRLGATLTTTR